jgi:hypothetical protein
VKGSEKMQILELPDELFQYYRVCTFGNENITKDQAARKLTRNYMLGMPVAPRNQTERDKGNQMVFYGNLHIVVRHGKIVHLSNHKRGKYYGGWKKDEKRYIELTKELGII